MVNIDLSGENFNNPQNQITTAFGIRSAQFDGDCCPESEIRVLFSIGPIPSSVALAQKGKNKGLTVRVFIRRPQRRCG